MHEVLARENFNRDAKFLSPILVANRNWKIHAIEFPIIDIIFLGKRPLRVKFICDDWDEMAPSVVLLDPNGNPAQGLPGVVFHQDQHPVTNRSFVCMRGFREYHIHPSHLDDKWATYRGQDGMNLVGLIDQLSRAWRKMVGI